jgi:hypothetical protein
MNFYEKFSKNAGKRHGWIGRSIGLFFDEQGSPMLTIGPDWQFFVCMISTIFGIGFFMTVVVAWDKPMLQMAGFLVYGTTLLAYGTTALRNPGIELKVIDFDTDLETLVKE